MNLRDLDVWALFRPLALGSAVIILPFSLLAGILALFGAPTVASLGEHIYGVGAVFLALLAGAVMPVLMAFNFCLFAAVSLWLYRRLLNRDQVSSSDVPG